MAKVYAEKTSALEWIDANRDRFSDFHTEIWNYAEPAYREYRSAQAYVELLRREFFDVEEGSAEMPTAFKATWGRGGPVSDRSLPAVGQGLRGTRKRQQASFIGNLGRSMLRHYEHVILRGRYQ